MPTWSGWQNQFLNRANLIVTPPNLTFMTQWANHAPGSCKNNPNDLSKSVSGSSKCGATVAGFGRSQNYPSHTAAAQAFQQSIDTAWVKPLKDAINSGNPFQIGDRSAVVAVLDRWGSTSFAKWYATATNQGTSGGGGGGGGLAPQTLKGWDALRKSVNSGMPNSLRESRKLTAQALRDVVRARRVHR